MSHLLVIDQGTHASRCVVFDENHHILALEEHPVSLYRHSADKIEQNAEKILGSIYAGLNGLAQKNALQQVTTAALVTQRSTIVGWHKTSGKALTTAISWQDTRATAQLAAFTDQEQIHQITGLTTSPHYGASKIRWLLEYDSNCQQALQDNELIIAPLSSYLIKQLTHNSHALVDHVNASRTLLFDIQQQDWSEELLQQMGIPRQILPDCLPCEAEYGKLRQLDIPLILVTGDQNAALYANGSPPANQLLINIGTGAFVLKTTGEQLQSHPVLIAAIAHSSRQHCYYLQEGTVNGAGAAIATLYDEIEETHLFESLPGWLKLVNDPPIYINSIGGLGSPWWNNQVKDHFIDQPAFDIDLPERAVSIIESIAFLIMNNIELLRSDSTDHLMITGGLGRLDGLCQKIADLSQIRTQRPTFTEATACGASWLVAKPEEIPPRLQQHRFKPQPNPALAERYRQFCYFMQQVTQP